MGVAHKRGFHITFIERTEDVVDSSFRASSVEKKINYTTLSNYFLKNPVQYVFRLVTTATVLKLDLKKGETFFTRQGRRFLVKYLE